MELRTEVSAAVLTVNTFFPVECGEKKKVKSGYINFIYFLIKSLRIEPCVVDRKNRFIF